MLLEFKVLQDHIIPKNKKFTSHYPAFFYLGKYLSKTLNFGNESDGA